MIRGLLALLLSTASLSACGTSVSLSDEAPVTPPSSTAVPRRPTPSAGPTPTPRPSDTPRPSTSPGPPSPRPGLDDWDVGASPLPLRPDGFGQVLRTPPELRVRRLPTEDLLPPPRTRRFEASVARVSVPVRRRMGRTWSPRCPVALRDLRYVTVTFWGFDHSPHTGELVL
ncbi:MAG: M15 family peptidase, partial [Actinomycetota bacterium]|nr:M15 family peptidase [Actinomycetota bacterium]